MRPQLWMSASFLVATTLIVSTSFDTATAQTPPPGASPASTTPLTAEDLRAQRSFAVSNGTAVAMDIQNVNLDLTFDPQAQQAQGRAVIGFTTLQQGLPYFLLNAPIQSVTLDGRPVTAERVPDADDLNQVMLVSEAVSPGETHTLEVQYTVDDENVSFPDGGVGFVTSMADIDDGNFMESYAPTNFEDDQYSSTTTLNLVNATGQHQLFTNGSAIQNGETSWTIQFPAYFNTSSFYLHLTNKELSVERGTYQGLEREIPWTVYSASASETREAAALVPELFQELESTYGPYFHQSFTAYISGAGGMEHAGAAITEIGALGHEMLHTWFARGVQPSNGNSGWIDEGIATWRDNGYQREAPEDRFVVNLANFSIFERFTPFAAYAQGDQFMRELDSLFAGQFGGLRPLLAEFFAQARGQVITTPAFQSFLENRTGTNLADRFQRYVYGGDQPPSTQAPGAVAGQPIPGTNHPPALTPQQIEGLR